MVFGMFGRLRAFAVSRPPLVVFALCVFAFALTTVTLASYVKYSEKLTNQDAASEWNGFLKFLSSFELCILAQDNLESNHSILLPPTSDEPVRNVAVSVTASLNLLQRLGSLHSSNITSLSGFLPLSGWCSPCRSTQSPDTTEGKFLNVTLTLPSLATLNASSSPSMNVCVTLTGPASVLPIAGLASDQPDCPVIGMLAAGRLMAREAVGQTLGERLDTGWCANGELAKLIYPADTPGVSVLLTDSQFAKYHKFKNTTQCSVLAPIVLPYIRKIQGRHLFSYAKEDRSVIHLHLVYSSYLLLALALVLLVYAAIRGRRFGLQHILLADKDSLDA